MVSVFDILHVGCIRGIHVRTADRGLSLRGYLVPVS